MSAGQLLALAFASSAGWTIGHDLIPLVAGWLL